MPEDSLRTFEHKTFSDVCLFTLNKFLCICSSFIQSLPPYAPQDVLSLAKSEHNAHNILPVLSKEEEEVERKRIRALFDRLDTGYSNV